MSPFPWLLIVHALAATVWTGGHLVLDLGVLPKALRERSAAAIRSFEETFEPLGLTALAIQVLTGLWMGWSRSIASATIRRITEERESTPPRVRASSQSRCSSVNCTESGVIIEGMGASACRISLFMLAQAR